MNLNKSFWIGLFAALAVLTAILLWSLNGHPYLRDSAELTTATATGGIGHPTGFPALHSVAGLFRSFPLGPLSMRMVWISALSALAALAFLGFGALRLRGKSQAPTLLHVLLWFAASASFLATDTLWHHTTNLEIYLPMVACVGAVMGLGFLVLEAGIPSGAWNLMALITGLSVGVHSEAMLLSGLMLAGTFLWVLARSESSRGRVFLQALYPAFPLFVAGALSLVYLPIRSAAGTPLDWGHTSTLAGFWDHVTAATIRGSFAQQMLPGLPGLMANASRYLGQLWEQSGPMVLLAVPALVLLGRRRPGAAVLVGLVWVGDAFFSVVMNPMAQVELQTSAVSFWLAHLLVLSLVFEVAHSLPRQWAALAALVVFASWNVASATDRSWRSGSAAYELGLDGWQQVPAGGVLLTSSDELSGHSLYQRLVEHRRPDVVHGVRQMICDPAFLALATQNFVSADQATEVLRQQAGPVCERVARTGPPSELWLGYLQALRAKKVPVVWEMSGASGPEDKMADAFVVPGFPALPLDWNRDLDSGFTVEQWLAPASAWLQPRLKASLPDSLTGWVLAEFMALLSTRVTPTNQAQRDLLAGFLETAVAVGPTSCKARNNLLAQRMGRDTLSSAIVLGMESLHHCPDHLLLRVNLLRALLLSGQYPEARQQLGELRRIFAAENYGPRLENMRRQMESFRLQEAVQILGEPE